MIWIGINFLRGCVATLQRTHVFLVLAVVVGVVDVCAGHIAYVIVALERIRHKDVIV